MLGIDQRDQKDASFYVVVAQNTKTIRSRAFMHA